MAKKPRPSIADMFTSTEKLEEPSPALQVDPDKRPDEIEIPAEGRTLPVGVGLKESELELLDRIADEQDVARNGLIRFAVRYFLKAYLAGDVQLETQKEYSERRGPKQLRME